MSLDWYQDIVDLHKAFRQLVGEKPGIPDWGTICLREHLINEEVGETLDGIREQNLVKIADGIADSIVVLLGTAVSYGIDLRPIWNEVHKTNMAKLGGGQRADGKFLKPEGWEPPDIERILKEQENGNNRTES